MFLLALTLVIPSCGGGGGGGGGGTVTPPVTTTDTTPPSIAFSYPGENDEFVFPATIVTPSYLSLSYADTQSTVDVSSLTASYTMYGRTISLTDLFPKDSVTNAATSRTPAANVEPLVRTSVSFFSSGTADFSTPASVATVARAGNGLLSMSCVEGTSKAYIWNPADTNIYIITQPSSPTTSSVGLTFAPAAFESASDRGRYYATRSGFSQLFVFDSDTNQLAGTVNLTDEPQLLAYHQGTGKLYISYKTSLTISRLDVASGTLDAFSGAVGSVPALLTTRKGSATGGVFAVWPTGGRYHLFEYDASGVIIRNVTLDLMQPSDIEFVTSGYVYLSNFGTNTLTRITLSDNSTRSIGVGSLPKKMIVSGSDGVYVINSGGRSLTLVRGASVIGTYTSQPLLLDGDSTCFSGRIAVAEDIWSISTRVQGVLSATVKDARANTGSTTRNIYIKPESIGP